MSRASLRSIVTASPLSKRVLSAIAVSRISGTASAFAAGQKLSDVSTLAIRYKIIIGTKASFSYLGGRPIGRALGRSFFEVKPGIGLSRISNAEENGANRRFRQRSARRLTSGKFVDVARYFVAVRL